MLFLQDKRFEQEKAVVVKNFENDLQNMSDQQKKQVDKAEEQQHIDLKVTSKKIRAEQEKELKGFRESLKQEVKLLKHEVELLPKDRRKEELKLRKENLEHDQRRRVRIFSKRSIKISRAERNKWLASIKDHLVLERISREGIYLFQI